MDNQMSLSQAVAHFLGVADDTTDEHLIAKLNGRTTTAKLWVLVCTSCSKKVTDLNETVALAHAEYNKSCILANNVYGAYAANMQRLYLASELGKYMDVQAQLQSVQDTINAVVGLKDGIHCLLANTEYRNTLMDNSSTAVS